MKKKINVAVDGTAGSGKSSVMSIVAKKIGYIFIDTGLMYRAYTRLCLENKINFSNLGEMISILKKFNCKYDQKGNLFVDEKNYTPYLFEYEIAENVKYIAAVKKIRKKMVKLQKKICKNKGNIMIGRDITTVVLPKADLKIYFDSSIQARAQRRYDQNQKLNIKPNNFDDILKQISQRDEWDKNRNFGALKIAKNTWYLDTSNFTIPQVVKKIIEKIKELEGN